MSLSGNVVNTGSVFVGQSYQRNTSGYVDVYCQILLDKIGDETSEGVNINYAASFLYGGWQNVVPFEVGCFIIPEGWTDVNWDLTNPLKTQTLFTIESRMNGNSWWFGEDVNGPRFVSRSNEYNIGILPYAKIGGITYGQTGPGGCGPWDAFNTEYGILHPATTSANANWPWGSTFTFNGVTREDLPCWCVLGGKNDTVTLSYDNCPIKLEQRSSIYVANASGVYRPSTAVYVYGSDGKPKRASSLTVYDANGKPKTIYI